MAFKSAKQRRGFFSKKRKLGSDKPFVTKSATKEEDEKARKSRAVTIKRNPFDQARARTRLKKKK